jgi:Leucine-rich repeat (LRR) protein
MLLSYFILTYQLYICHNKKFGCNKHFLQDDNINYNNFSQLQLDGQEFSNLIELEELHLNQNYLEKLPDGLFLHINTLKKLFLFSNNLEYLGSNTFEGLVNLSALLINNNLLRSFSDSTFSPVSNLLKL